MGLPQAVRRRRRTAVCRHRCLGRRPVAIGTVNARRSKRGGVRAEVLRCRRRHRQAQRQQQQREAKAAQRGRADDRGGDDEGAAGRGIVARTRHRRTAGSPSGDALADIFSRMRYKCRAKIIFVRPTRKLVRQ